MTSPISARLPTSQTEQSTPFRGRTQSYLEILSTNHFCHDTPPDGSCLIWAFLLAYFTVSINDKTISLAKFFHIFSNSLEPHSFEDFYKLISTYDGQRMLGNEDLKKRIIKSLRTTIANKMIAERHLYEPFVAIDCSFEQYIQMVLHPLFWGGDSEIRALSDAFSIPICVTHDQYETVNYFGANYTDANQMLYLHNRQTVGINPNETGNHFNFLSDRNLVQTSNNLRYDGFEGNNNFSPKNVDILESRANAASRASNAIAEFSTIASSPKMAVEKFLYPFALPTSQDGLLWSFIFGHFLPDIKSQESTRHEIFEFKLDSMFESGDISSNRSDFKELLECFDLNDPTKKTLSLNIKNEIKSCVSKHLRSIDQTSFSIEQKQKINKLIKDLTVECDFTLHLYLEALSAEFGVPILLVKELQKPQLFGSEFISETIPVCIEMFAANNSNQPYQYRPRFIEDFQTIAAETFLYPLTLPTSQDCLLWSFIFGHFLPNIKSQESKSLEIFEFKFNSMFGSGYISSKRSDFKALLDHFNLNDPIKKTLSLNIKNEIKSCVSKHLRSIDQTSFSSEQKQKINKLIKDLTVECDFTLQFFLEVLSAEFGIPIILVKKLQKPQLFGSEFISETTPVYIEMFAANNSNHPYQYRPCFIEDFQTKDSTPDQHIPGLINPPQINSLMSNEAAFDIVQKLGPTKALELYPDNENIFKFSLLKISGIFPGTKLFKTLNDNVKDPFNNKSIDTVNKTLTNASNNFLIGLFISKVGAKKAIAMFPSYAQVTYPAVAKSPELFLSLNKDSQLDSRFTTIYLNKFRPFK